MPIRWRVTGTKRVRLFRIAGAGERTGFGIPSLAAQTDRAMHALEIPHTPGTMYRL